MTGEAVLANPREEDVLIGRVLTTAVALIVIAAVIGVGFVLQTLYHAPKLEIPEGSTASAVMLTVEKGEAFSSITHQLSRMGLVRHPWVLDAYAYLRRYDRRIHAGTYQFTPGERPKDILAKLVRGDVLKVSVTIPEGFTAREIARVLGRSAGIDSTIFLEMVSKTDFWSEWDVETASLEGYLFPDTYWIPWGSDEEAVIEMMLLRLEKVFGDSLEQRCSEIKMTEHEVLTLASIVEAETRIPEERPLVAAVYHNRLRRHMRLEADPTVAYAMGGYRGRLLYKDLSIASPYNTYVHFGLPPGPICSPGEASILAALYPDSASKALYFVARGDGSHIFSLTLQEHREAVRKAKQGKSKP